MNFLPQSKDEDIVVQDLGSELMVYDLAQNKAFHLNETAAMVWKYCDGSKTVEDITAAVRRKVPEKVGKELIILTLDGLRKENLLLADEGFRGNLSRVSRRDLVRKAALGSMLALPLISGIIAPTAAHAQSAAACTNTCQCNAGSAVYLVNTACTTPNQGSGNVGVDCPAICTCQVTSCPTDPTAPCSGTCIPIV